MALQFMQLVLFFRMSSPTLMLGSTWASLDVSMHVVFILSGWVWGDGPVSPFGRGHRYAQLSLGAAVICSQGHHCCRKEILVGEFARSTG